jgi:hypothetical protein
MAAWRSVSARTSGKILPLHIWQQRRGGNGVVSPRRHGIHGGRAKRKSERNGEKTLKKRYRKLSHKIMMTAA